MDKTGPCDLVWFKIRVGVGAQKKPMQQVVAESEELKETRTKANLQS